MYKSIQKGLFVSKRNVRFWKQCTFQFLVVKFRLDDYFKKKYGLILYDGKNLRQNMLDFI
jgi:hypothetical protein